MKAARSDGPAIGATGPPLRRYLGTVLALAALALLFIAGSYLYVHLAGRLLAQARTLPPALLLALAVVGGAASFFSSCSIAITPGFLAYFIGGQSASTAGNGGIPRERLLAGSGLVALGIVSFYAVAGLLIAWLGAVIYNYLIYLIPIVGLIFLILGYLLVSGQSFGLNVLARINPANRYYEATEVRVDDAVPADGSALYRFGLLYGAASHTCTLPIFLGIVLVPLASGAYWLAGLTFLLNGEAIAVLLVTISVLGLDLTRFGGDLEA